MRTWEPIRSGPVVRYDGDAEAMKRLLVTGGAGYVGSMLVRDLLNRGDQVVCVDSLKFGGEALIDIWGHPRFSFHRCDITDFDAVDRVLDGARVDAVVHLAAIVGDPACKREPEQATRTNWDAAVHLLEKAMSAKLPRFVFASTCSNYGRMADPTSYVSEESPLAPVSLYAELKVRFEQLLLQEIPKTAAFSPTALRFATVYGLSPRMRFDLTVNEFTKVLALGEELVVFGEQFWRPYCHVSEFSRAIQTVLDAPREKVAFEVFNVGSTSENYTKRMIVDEISKQIPTGRVKYVEKAEDPRDYRVDFSKIKATLGFETTKTVPDGIREVRDVIQMGVITDPGNRRYYNS
jgi:nucleoside-diphosphate-sugar epimerase